MVLAAAAPAAAVPEDDPRLGGPADPLRRPGPGGGRRRLHGHPGRPPARGGDQRRHRDDRAPVLDRHASAGRARPPATAGARAATPSCSCRTWRPAQVRGALTDEYGHHVDATRPHLAGAGGLGRNRRLVAGARHGDPPGAGAGGVGLLEGLGPLDRRGLRRGLQAHQPAGRDLADRLAGPAARRPSPTPSGRTWRAPPWRRRRPASLRCSPPSAARAPGRRRGASPGGGAGERAAAGRPAAHGSASACPRRAGSRSP